MIEMTYNDFIDCVENGSRYKIDLINKKSYLKEYGSKKWKEVKVQELVNPTSWETVEELYAVYKKSIPTNVKLNGNYPYFKAVRNEELNDMDIFYGEQRNVAQAMLELYILIADLEIEGGKWFWQSEKDKDLVVKRTWIKGN